MKFEILKKHLIKLGIICGVIVFVLGTIYYFISDYRASNEEELAQLKTKVNTTNAQLDQLQKKLKEYNDASSFYEEFKSSGNADAQNFRRDFAKNLLSKLNEQVGLVDLKFNMDQFQRMGGSYETKTIAMFSSKVTVQYTANSDIDSFNFIKSIVSSFPGVVYVSAYSIKTVREVSIELLTSLAEGRTAPGLVTGEITFEWRGIQDNPDAPKEGNNPASPSPNGPSGPNSMMQQPPRPAGTPNG